MVSMHGKVMKIKKKNVNGEFFKFYFYLISSFCLYRLNNNKKINTLIVLLLLLF